MEVININNKLDLITEYWDPKVIAQLNGQYVKLAKIKGEFDWHKHDDEDELFQVIKGTLQMELRDKTLTLREGEICVVPRGVEHKPVALEEVHILLFEPMSTLNTGDKITEKTRTHLEHL